MSFRYKLKQEDETASQIAIDPVVGQNFVIVDNLEAGTYNFSIGRSIYWKVKGIADRNAEDFELDTPFTLYIRPGEVFIPNVKIEIDKYNAGEHKYTTRFSTVELPPEGRDEYLAKLKSTENSNMWQLVTEE